MFLTPEQTGGPLIFALRKHNRYLAMERGRAFQEFDVRRLAEALGQGLPLSAGAHLQGCGQIQAGAGETWQEHRALILLACCEGRLFEWIEGYANGDIV